MLQCREIQRSRWFFTHQWAPRGCCKVPKRCVREKCSKYICLFLPPFWVVATIPWSICGYNFPAIINSGAWMASPARQGLLLCLHFPISKALPKEEQSSVLCLSYRNRYKIHVLCFFQQELCPQWWTPGRWVLTYRNFKISFLTENINEAEKGCGCGGAAVGLWAPGAAGPALLHREGLSC